MNRLFDVGSEEKSGAESRRRRDCFYTNRSAAKRCMALLAERCPMKWDLWIEPSAGAGAFFDLMPEPKIGLDIEPPPRPDIIQADFLEWSPPVEAGRIIVVGNPPFGKNASLAVKFFNHAASFADAVAMIHPRTFQKESTARRLNRFFHLEAELLLPRDSFTLDGAPYAVPCVFQIWLKRPSARSMTPPPLTHPDFRFAKPGEADFAIQRVGANAGRVKFNPRSLSPTSHYFIAANAPGVAEVMRRIDWREAAARTAGNPSLAKSEVVMLYSRHQRRN